MYASSNIYIDIYALLHDFAFLGMNGEMYRKNKDGKETVADCNKRVIKRESAPSSLPVKDRQREIEHALKCSSC